MLNHSLSTLLGQLESGAFGKLLHAEVSPSGRAELTEPLQERLRTSYWPRDGGRAGLPPALCQASWGPGTPLPGYQLYCAVLSRFSHVRPFATLWTATCQDPVHGILQARILEWVAMPSSRESSQPRV